MGFFSPNSGALNWRVPRTAPGACRCGIPDKDSDGDGTPDYIDSCSSDPAKTNPGICGCGVADTDEDKNGVIDCLCASVNVTEAQDDLLIGPEKLRDLSQSALNSLNRNANKAKDKGLSKRLKSSAKAGDKKLQKFILLAEQSHSQLPKIVTLCPLSIDCANVDNTSKIETYRGAVTSLSNQIVHVLNRATRLVYPSPKLARKKTKAFGKAVKATREALLVKAASLPKTQSVCSS